MIKKRLGLSLIASMMLLSTAYSGKIITNAGDVENPIVTPNNQYGFGGWNFDNIDVRIVNTNDFSGSVGTFYENNGTYTTMGEDMSFESDIWSLDGMTLLAHLHGKDWPVGEPAGIKIINNDLKVQHGKPFNCIMNTSYLDVGYLDTVNPQPVICSSDFQTHKRFKINLLPSTIEGTPAGGWGRAVDIVFNLDMSDTNTTVRRYQVLQKINNYTDKRLDGYSLEVLDENGTSNPYLKLSLGYGEGDNGTNIWDESELANMSHGLWGPIDNHFPEPGFFDQYRAYFPITFNTPDNNSIGYTGDMGASNYQKIFGNWLPSIWAPKGIFHDDDMNPATDGVLVAFWGTIPGERYTGTPAWHKGFVDNWEIPSSAELDSWQGTWYEQSTIEDVLNLGLNYIVEVGENAKIGSTFIIRITPHVSTDQVPPAYICDSATQHSAQGSLGCVDDAPATIVPPYLPDIPDPRFIQGTTIVDTNATVTTPWELPVCADGNLSSTQGTDICL